ncbi:hypothetical protein AKJ49_02185 [candidate division MSBL1 archaeon SCGC-AAA382A03]|uniref:Ornithine cyclodeaminase n=1 Tax=candidate division MSBL1 archaeon SCGC-AAA382A03 TaxID=1698278 RepID=A0A133VD62_9EURY|nr:hypothetical protein AKJ49_02185 [candidate division MSBL1 archaeon SCGC-AAA382A03]
MNFEKVLAYDVLEGAQSQYVEEMSEKYDLEIEGKSGPREVAENADVLVNATKEMTNPVGKKEWLDRKGILVCPLVGATYWYPEAINSMDKIYVDDIDQYLSFWGDREGYPDESSIFGEIGEVIIGKKKGRENNKEKIMTINEGLAIEDISVGKEVYDLAKEKNIGKKIELF